MRQELNKLRGFLRHILVKAVSEFSAFFPGHIVNMTLAGMNDILTRRNFPRTTLRAYWFAALTFGYDFRLMS
jgi:hypothetical protein